MRGIKNITVNYDNGEIETLNKGVVVSFDEIDNEELGEKLCLSRNSLTTKS